MAPRAGFVGRRPSRANRARLAPAGPRSSCARVMDDSIHPHMEETMHTSTIFRCLVVLVLALLLGPLPIPPSPSADGIPQQAIDLLQLDTVGLNAVNKNLLDHIDNTSPPDQSNSRFTPPVFVLPGQIVSCTVTNVSNSDLSVHIQLIRKNGTLVFSVEQPIPFYHSADATGPIILPDGAGLQRCRFTVTTANASRASIRAALEIDFENTIVLTIPAE